MNLVLRKNGGLVPVQCKHWRAAIVDAQIGFYTHIEDNIINATWNHHEKPRNTDWNDGVPLHYFCGPL